jgi:menaquinone-9 beta-reductase
LYDLIVVGGGPAGCAAAITAARRGGSVLLLEKGVYPRQKVCGEFISAEAVRVLSMLLEAAAGQALDAAPEIGTMRIFVDGGKIETTLSPAGKSLPRYILDDALWHACLMAGVDARQKTTVSNVVNREVSLTSGEKCSGRTVVDATGRWSNLMAKREFEVPKHRWIGVKSHFIEREASRTVDLYHFPGGYCGVQPVDNDTVNACAMVRADVATSLPEVFERHPELRRRSFSWQMATNPVTTSPLIFREPCPQQGSILYAGDAAGFVDPFVGDGISLALHSGIAAAEALAPVWLKQCSPGSAAERYHAEYDRRFRPVFRRAAFVRHLFAMPKAVRILAARLARLPGVTEKLVRMTRAA